jgi:hypothetical protein
VHRAVWTSNLVAAPAPAVALPHSVAITLHGSRGGQFVTHGAVRAGLRPGAQQERAKLRVRSGRR